MLGKRIFDVVCASIGLALLVPLFAIIAVLIKLDSRGPIFFVQERVGKNRRIFRIFKFRTMVVRAENMGQITVGKDTRITRLGHVLRHFRIDELPQLLNVVLGDMSLVGPRPEVPRYVACYPPEAYATVLSVLPGITDWASIRFKDENAMLSGASDPERRYVEEILPIKLAYHERYVRERSFVMDLQIILATLSAIFFTPRDIA
jgi:lipopolysaccharide/colanic/teichoic acid biosynthesis glycosyltransferase